MMEDLLSFSANHLWQSTVVGAVVGLLAWALRENRAQTRYGLWLVASAKFLIPFSLLVGMGSHLGKQIPAQASGISYAMERVSQPFAGAAPLQLRPAVGSAVGTSWIPIGLAVVWAIGSAAVIFSWWRRWRGLRAALRTASPVDVGREIRAMASAQFREPGVFGIRRPVLLLPAGITERLTEAEWKALVAHELCHVRRRDNLTAAIHMGVEALFWFHPLVWWLGARLMEERERACDQEVLALGTEPVAYAEGILKVCDLCLDAALPCVAGVTGSNLKQRIEEILRNRPARRLSFFRKTLLAAAAAIVVAAPVMVGMLNAPMRAQSAPETGSQAGAAFEVASLKPDKKGCADIPRKGNFSPSPGRLEMPCVNLQNLIQAAYGTFADGVSINTQPLKMEGGPSWMRSDFYSLSAKAEGPVRTEMLAGPMLRRLLAERFQLKAHRETREMPVYALRLGKGGLKVQPLAEGACTPLDLTHPPPPGKAGEPPPNVCGVMMMGPAGNGRMKMEVQGSTMAQFAQRLSGRVDRTVMDETGVAGKFNFHLEFVPDQHIRGQQVPMAGRDPGAADAPAAGDAEPDLFGALQQQLGLKLDSARGPVGVLVIDHVERPSEN